MLRTQSPGVPAKLTLRLAVPMPIEVRYWDESGYMVVRLSWKRPDGGEEIVPYTALQPPAPMAMP